MLLVLPVGGADVPIVISLLNAFTGLTVAAGGYVLDNTLLLVAGTLVGASGTILTRLMAAAMGRSVTAHPVRRAQGRLDGGLHRGVRPAGRSAAPDDVAILLGYARKVVDRARATASRSRRRSTRMRELADVLEAPRRRRRLRHPPGRRPHARPHERAARRGQRALRGAQGDGRGQPRVRTADVALVVGANDVVNPAAQTSPGAPIYGMPILDVDEAQAVVFLKRSMRPGFAGIENELLYDPKTTLLFGDAKDSLTKLVVALKSV